MSGSTSSKNLPLALDLIAQHHLEGELICNLAGKASTSLFFRRGQLVYACSTISSVQDANEALYQLLQSNGSTIEWQPLQVRMAQPNISADVSQAFFDVLQILIANGQFNKPEESELDNNFFQLQTVKPQTVPVVPKQQNTSQVAKPSVPAKRVYSVERNLLLPPGQHQHQLEDLLATVSFKEQLEILQRAHLTGYIYYQHGNETGDYGLVLLINGDVTDVVCQSGGQQSLGVTAHHTLSATVSNLKAEIYKVELKVLKAYRAMVNPGKLARELPLTKPNFVAAVEAFKQSHWDGIITLDIDSLKLHYFFLFDNGLQIGVFGPEAETGRLQPLAAPLAVPGADNNAIIRVSVSVPPRHLSFGPDKAKPAQSEPPRLPTRPAAVAPVNWNTLLRLDTPSKPTPEVNITDDANPFDF